jgi:hypothetical protein
MWKKNLSCSDNLITILHKFKITILKIFIINSAYITSDTAKTNIKNRIYHYTTPRETVICDNDGVTGDCYRTDKSNTNFSNKMLAFFYILNNSFFIIWKNCFWSLEFWIDQFYCVHFHTLRLTWRMAAEIF